MTSMSDLNQLIKKYKKSRSLKELRERYEYIIKKYGIAESGPLCCFWVRKLKDLRKREFIDGYIELNEFRNYADDSDGFVIGCSRGCINLNCDNYEKIYWEKLCKECINEAKEILKIKNSV